MSHAFAGGTAAEYSDDPHLRRYRSLDAVYSVPRRVVHGSNGIDVDDAIAAEVAGLQSDARASA
jgi:hypothetical protein